MYVTIGSVPCIFLPLLGLVDGLNATEWRWRSPGPFPSARPRFLAADVRKNADKFEIAPAKRIRSVIFARPAAGNRTFLSVDTSTCR